MLLPTVIVLSATLTISATLKCYAGGPVANNGSVLVPLQECHPTAYSCMRTVDLATNMASYYCSASNCTDKAGAVSDIPICYNTTNDLQMNCCCYTDGCNSSVASQAFFNPYLPKIVLITFICVFFSYVPAGSLSTVMSLI